MIRIFISYSHVDRPFVDQLIEKLQKHYQVWIDHELIGGDIWWQEIHNQIAMCDVFIYVLSNESVNSSYCQQEYELAKRFRKSIVPVLARARTGLPEELAHIQSVDMAFGVENEQALKKLYLAVDPDYDKKLALSNQRKWRIRFWLLLIFLLIIVTFIRQFSAGRITGTITTPTHAPSQTPLAPASATPVPTSTAEFTFRLYQPVDREEALTFSGFWQQVIFRDISEPGTVQYDVAVNPDQPLRATFNWCADTVERLEDILLPTDFQFTLDGTVLSDTDFLLTRYMQTGVYICQNWDVVIEGWLPGRSTSFVIQYSINEDIYDGFATYLAGEYYHEIRIHPNSDVLMCRGSVPSQLVPGINARITPGDNSRLRETPSREGRSYARATAGSLIEIVSGPICEGNHIWWRVYYDTRPYEDSSNTEEYYYVAEGNSLSYFIEPLVMPSAMAHTKIVPVDSSLTILSAYQEFERGHMFWLQNLQQIWVLYDNGQREIFADKEAPAGWETIDVDYNPPDGLFEPVSGFEIVWELNPHVRDSTGWALAPEIGFNNTVEYLPYQGAIVLRDDKGNRYYLYANFRWERERTQE